MEKILQACIIIFTMTLDQDSTTDLSSLLFSGPGPGGLCSDPLFHKTGPYQYLSTHSGGQVASEKTPEGDSLIFLHGLFGSCLNWRAVLEQLEGTLWAMALEVPIFDSNALLTSVPDMTDYVADFLIRNPLPARKSLWPGGGFLIGGNSLGGQIGLDLAWRYPERVRGLILTGSGGLFERGFESAVPRRPSRAYLRPKFEEIFFDPRRVSAPLVDWARQIILKRENARQLARIVRSARRYHLGAALKEIRCPVLLLWGRQDTITPPNVAEQFHRELPRSELVWLDRCAHAPMIERPTVVAREIKRWVCETY